MRDVISDDRSFRWVLVRNNEDEAWAKRMLVVYNSDRCLCVAIQHERNFINQKEFKVVSWKQFKES